MASAPAPPATSNIDPPVARCYVAGVRALAESMVTLEVVDTDGRRFVEVAGEGPFVIGRSAECQLQVKDGQVSRRHCELRIASGEWEVVDCRSRFGTFLNGARIDRATLRPGDRLRVGQTEIGFGGRSADGVPSSGGPDLRQMGALLASLGALGSTHVLDEVLAIVIDSALDVTGAERGFILLANDELALELKLARQRGGRSLPEARTSRVIPDRVFATGVDEAVADLQDDEHAAAHRGTIALGIRHVVCTPLTVASYGGEAAVRRIGVLYLDAPDRGHLQQLATLRALAAQAAIVIENARLYHEVLEREKAAQELRVAARIQQALLPPSHYTGPLVELAAKTTPCLAVGGDFFEYSEREGSVSFVVGDVAGKGTSAALLTAVIQGLFAAEAEARDAPGLVLARINRSLCRRAIEARFVTAFYGQIEAGRLQYCNAGHNAPFLITRSGVLRLEAGGTVMGFFDSAQYVSTMVSVEPGDVLLTFSDGVTEAVNTAGDELGDARLAASLEGMRARPVAAVLAAVDDLVRQFCGGEPVRDDVTIMALRVR